MPRNAAFIFVLVGLLSTSAIAQISSPQVDFKFGKGLQITAADSSVSLKIRFRFQSLLNTETELFTDREWDTDASFMIRRARLKFDGWAWSPRFVYKVELALSNRDLSSSRDFAQTSGAPKIILDAVLKYKLNKHLSLWAGQTKLPGNRERVVSSQSLQFVDRSRVNSIFNIDREMAIQLHGKFPAFGQAILQPAFSWSMGEGRNITIGNTGEYHYTGRLEFLPLGAFSGKGDYFQSDLAREATPKLAIGATLSLNEGTSRQSATGHFLVDSLGNYLAHDVQTFFLDFILKYQGFSLMGEYADKKVTDLMRPDVKSRTREEVMDKNGRSYLTGKGYNLQVSYLFKNNVELATRFTKVRPDTPVSFNKVNEYTLGISKYISGHDLKLQSDISLIEEIETSPNRLRVRFQMEVAF